MFRTKKVGDEKGHSKKYCTKTVVQISCVPAKAASGRCTKAMCLFSEFFYTCSKTRLNENVFQLTPALILKRSNVFELTSFFEKVYKYLFSAVPF